MIKTSGSVSSHFQSARTQIENATRRRVFLTKFEVFGNVMKHSLECLIYLLDRS